MRRLIVTLLLTAAAVAQQGEVTIKSYTKLVQVPVVVTDKHGQPVKGLSQRDFVLYENGKPVKIAAFQSPEDRKAAPGAVRLAPSAAGVYSNLNATAAAERPIVIFVIDGINTPFLAQLQARRQLMKLLSESITTDTQMSLMVITTRGLRVIHEYTTDPKVLIAALKKVSESSSGNALATAEAAPAEMNGAPVTPAADTGSLGQSPIQLGALGQSPVQLGSSTVQLLNAFLTGPVEFKDLVRTNQNELTLQCLRQIAQRFSGVPGRKSLLWAASVFPYFADDRTSATSTDISGRYISTFERLNDANIAIYPVDAAGIVPLYETSPYNTAMENPATFRNYRVPGGVLLVGTGDTALGKINATPEPVDTMKTVADLTGGTAFYGTNDLSGMMRKAIADSGDSYMLGYYIGGSAKPGRRELRVAVPGKDVKLRSRTRVFVTRDSFSAREEITAALKSPLPAANLPLTVKWDAKASNAPFVVALDPKSLELSEPNGHLDLTVVVEARTPEGKVLSQLDKTLTGDIAKLDDFRSRPFEYQDALSKLESPATVRFVVRDNNSGRLGSVIVNVN